MSKYILKRELPFAKAGTKIQVQIEKHANPAYYFEPGIISITPEALSKLIADGWIEEVIPREFYIVISPGMPNATFMNIHYAMHEADERGKARTEIIKTVEVIE